MIVRLATVPLLVLAIVIAGCGDDNDGDGTIETSSLTKAEFVKQADAICVKGNEAFLAELGNYLSKQEAGPKTEGEVSADGVRKAVLPVIKTQADEIEDLGAPSGDEEQIEAFLAAQRQAVASLEKRQSISLDSDLDSAFNEAGRLATQYGMEACAYG